MASYGFGGLGSSFPTRPVAPISSTVDWMGPQAAWQADWDRRYAAEAARASGPTEDQWLTAENTPGYFDMTKGFLGDPNKNWQVLNPGQTWDVNAAGDWYSYGSTDGPITGILQKGSAGYTPDFTALNAEKDKMLGLYNNQAALQQAYDGMQGNYQFNGNMTADYATPGFGQVTGINDPGTVNAPSGVNLPTGSGTYGGGQQTGIYSPQANRKTNWNF